jgi:F420-dependent oxidoreductase-like protein
MRIGLMLGDITGGGTVSEQVEQAVQAERDGFDTAWFGQLMGVDALTIIALAGPRTSRIELGAGVMPTYGRHPYVMAQQALTVRAATNNRFVLGVGLSHQVVIETMWGLSYEHPARHMREYLSVLLPLVREGRAAFSGDVFRVTAGVQVPGATPIPVLVAALAPRMLRIAGELADGTVTWMTGLKTVESYVVPTIGAAAKAAGRPQPRVAVGLPVCVHDDIAAAREAANAAFRMYGALPNYRRMLDKEGAGGPGDVAIVGDEAAVERQIREVASAGATDLVAPMYATGSDPAASLARTRALLKSLIGKV